MIEEDRGLPAALDAERTIMGAVLLDSAALLEISAVLKADDFSLDSHRRIFLRMVEVCERDSTVDIVTLSQALADQGEIASVGGVAYLASLTEGLPRRPEIDNYIKIVKDKALMRALVSAGTQLTARAYDQSETGLELAAWGAAAISAIADGGQARPDVYTAAEMADEAEYRLLDCPDEAPVIPTGITTLDEFTTGGMRLGELWVIGAAPSRGKTTLARQIVKNAITLNIPAYVHSGEMTKESWFDVTACLLDEMPAWKVREPRLMTPYERERLRASLRRLARMPFYVSDAGGISLDRLIWNATRAARMNGVKLVAVDYAQIINAPGREERQQVTAVAQKLRLFAKAENVAVLLLSQSPRPEGRNINARPTMFSLKESGALEEAAHTVILPYRPLDLETGQFTSEDELIIGKQRWGSIGHVDVTLNGEYLRFDMREGQAR